MELTVQGKQVSVGDALRTHVTGKMEDIDQKYFNHATAVTVTFAKEGHGHGVFRVHISYQVGKNIVINTDGEAGDPYGAFDTAAEKAAKRLRRYKRRLRDDHARSEKTPESEIMKARYYTLAIGQEAPEQDTEQEDVPRGDDPVVIAEMSQDVETLSVSEAVMRLDLSGQSALMFRNATHMGLNMVYRRSDGNIGWLDPEGNGGAKKAAKAKPAKPSKSK